MARQAKSGGLWALPPYESAAPRACRGRRRCAVVWRPSARAGERQLVLWERRGV